MNEFVADTMGLVIRIERRKVSQKVKLLFEEAEKEKSIIHIPTIVFAEVMYLSEKNRIKTTLEEDKQYMKQFRNLKEYPMSFSVVESASIISDIRELHDRLIAATARLLNKELITNDPIIQASSFVKTIW
ncbi:MAG: PIN domain-containing protein [Ignavibacteriales bacterium]|nr:PIN domain-containing protein [Ignavibacteriales bacterium]